LDPNDRDIVTNWYNSLPSKGSLNWNLANLCAQDEIECDDEVPYQRIIIMYEHYLFNSL